MKHWYFFKNKKVQGYCLGKVAKFAGYPISELVIQRVIFNGREFVVEKDNIWGCSPIGSGSTLRP